ncbi:hypothetical protein H0H92_003484 [Tricholoma furcatifolium]|nr:hypothetical protein H0H92_003484 [Tricholoma furcatifolium]
MGLRRLCSLSINSVLSTEAFVHLTQLSSLAYLKLAQYADDLDIPSALPSSAFQFLTELTAGDMAFDKCIQILELMGQGSVLQSLSIEYHEYPVVDTSQWPRLIHTIAATCSVDCLRKLHISDYDEMDVEAEVDFAAPGLQVTSDDITPLLKFANLKNLCLSAYHGFNLNDAFIKDMAIALPRLQKLTFRMSTWPRPLPAIHLSSLRHFAQHQHLCYLGLTLNACGMSRPNTTDDIQISNYGLRTLDVGFSTIMNRDIPYVAAFLSGIFPSLDIILHHYSRFDGDPEVQKLELNRDWYRVERLTEILAGVREQEIRRMRSLLVQ